MKVSEEEQCTDSIELFLDISFKHFRGLSFSHSVFVLWAVLVVQPPALPLSPPKVACGELHPTLLKHKLNLEARKPHMRGKS